MSRNSYKNRTALGDAVKTPGQDDGVSVNPKAKVCVLLHNL